LKVNLDLLYGRDGGDRKARDLYGEKIAQEGIKLLHSCYFSTGNREEKSGSARDEEKIEIKKAKKLMRGGKQKRDNLDIQASI